MRNTNILSGLHRHLLAGLVAAIGLLVSSPGDVRAGAFVFWLESDTPRPTLEWAEPTLDWTDFDAIAASEMVAPDRVALDPVCEERLSTSEQYDLFCEILVSALETPPESLPAEALEVVAITGNIDVESDGVSSAVWLALRDRAERWAGSDPVQFVARRVVEITQKTQRDLVDLAADRWEGASQFVHRAASAVIDSTARAATSPESVGPEDDSWATLLGDVPPQAELDDTLDDDFEDRAASTDPSLVRPVLARTAALLDTLSELLSDLSLQVSKAAGNPSKTASARVTPRRS